MEEKLDLILEKLDLLIHLIEIKAPSFDGSSKKQQSFDFFDEKVANGESLNKNTAAKFLGISRRCIYNYLKEWRELRKENHINGLKPKF